MSFAAGALTPPVPDAASDEAITFELCRPIEVDARQVMAWRNDPVTLSMCFHRDPKEWDSFWPEYRDCYFQSEPEPVFARFQGCQVAFLRFCPETNPQGLSDRLVDISINLAPGWRGRGLGTAILRAASDYLLAAGIDTIHAEIRCGNAASLHAFTAAGYQALGEAQKLVIDTGETASIWRFVLNLVPPHQQRGLFLDLDGTLADSLAMLRRVYQDFLAHFGTSGSEAEFQSLNGPPLVDIVDFLRTAHGLGPTAADLLALYTGMIAQSYATAPPAAGARDLLVRARQRGWLVAVVTSAPRELARKWLEQAGLEPLVDVIVGGDEISLGKPDPEPYLLALSRTGCAASCSLAVEDSLNGAISAAAASLPVWLLATDMPQKLVENPQVLGPKLLGTLADLATLARRL
ncbi:MAG: GNAT family N-acetyltransferase [Rhodospirillaceae bacterium]